MPIAVSQGICESRLCFLAHRIVQASELLSFNMRRYAFIFSPKTLRFMINIIYFPAHGVRNIGRQKKGARADRDSNGPGELTFLSWPSSDLRDSLRLWSSAETCPPFPCRLSAPEGNLGPRFGPRPLGSRGSGVVFPANLAASCFLLLNCQSRRKLGRCTIWRALD